MTSFFLNIRAVPLVVGLTNGYKIVGTEESTGETRHLYLTRNWIKACAIAEALDTMQAANKIIITG